MRASFCFLLAGATACASAAPRPNTSPTQHEIPRNQARAWRYSTPTPILSEHLRSIPVAHDGNRNVNIFTAAGQ